MAQFSIRNREAVLETLQEACSRRELLILVTPYLRFESTFVRMEGDCIHVAASMSHEDATYGLKTPDLRLRFPYRLHFLDGATRLMGFGLHAGRRTLRLAVPEILEDGDHRGAYRVEPQGRIQVTFSTRRYELLTGTLVNLSVTGTRIHALRDLEEGEVLVGDTLPITIPLTDGIYINTQAKVRYVHHRSLGLEFRPELPSSILTPLQRWILQKRIESEERETQRAAMAKEQGDGSGATTFVHRGLLLAGGSPDLEARLRELLAGLPPLTRIPATIQALKEIDPASQTLVLFHVAALGLDERKRLKLLIEGLGGRLPFVLLGTELEGAALLEVGTELKAAASYVLGATPGPFFKRLIQGILRRHFEEPAGA